MLIFAYVAVKVIKEPKTTKKSEERTDSRKKDKPAASKESEHGNSLKKPHKPKSKLSTRGFKHEKKVSSKVDERIEKTDQNITIPVPDVVQEPVASTKQDESQIKNRSNVVETKLEGLNQELKIMQVGDDKAIPPSIRKDVHFITSV